jgi:outer membrane receptor protein involved in Fe transport
MSSSKKFGFLLGAAAGALSIVAPAGAQEQAAAAQTPTASDEIVVQAGIGYRDRSDSTAPVLEYGTDYFQRFEPLTAGDALKRVPSVAFLSDVIESDGVRLRGLDPAYTQILINGEQVPGSGSSSGAFGNGAEQSFFVDRIPAELIERVEIVRSASANRSGDALAGAINIVLRDSYSLEGGFIRTGALRWDDGKVGTIFGGVYGGEILGGRALVGANIQDRHNPKRKRSLRFDRPGGTLDNIELQSDVRDGTDYSFNVDYEVDALGGEVKFNAFYVGTDRYENEDSIEYLNNTPGGISFANNQLSTLNDNNNDIDQTSYSMNLGYATEAFGGETRVKFGYAKFENENFEYEDETEFLRDANIFPEADRYTGDAAIGSVDDSEYKLKFEHERDLGAFTLEAGVHYEKKERDNLTAEAPRRRTGSGGVPALTAGTTSVRARPVGQNGPTLNFIAVPGGDNTIERTRIDPYLQANGDAGALAWEAGLRWETTETEIQDRTVAGALRNQDSDFQIVLPSASLRYDLTESDRITLSAARTVRNPSFNFLSPATLLEELGDNDFRGNPNLDPETAWGADVGYERRLGKTGVAGVNFFYRDVTDVIELFSTGVVGSAGPGTLVYSARNTGDGQVYGVEFDVSTPLSFVGLENTGVFLNYSWLDSKLDDEFGERTFNSQAEFVFNAGFIQDLPQWAASFGATYRKQGDAFQRVVGEEVTTEYGADLEMFVEKRFGERFTLRLVGSNLLNAEKKEFFNKFVTAADQRSRSFDEYEIEVEDAGSVYQLVGRLAF